MSWKSEIWCVRCVDDVFEIVSKFVITSECRGTPETCCKPDCLIELLKRRVCTADNRLDVLENLNLYDITSSYERLTHNWYFVWTYDTQRSCVVRRTIISTDGDNHCGTCYLYSSVVNDMPYELFKCSDVYVKDEPYACFDWKNWLRIPYIRSISARQVWVHSEV